MARAKSGLGEVRVAVLFSITRTPHTPGQALARVRTARSTRLKVSLMSLAPDAAFFS